jgi:hypothetical protein
MEALPDKFEDRVSVLYAELENGIEKLLTAAKKRSVLQAPYGRPPPFSPYISEADPSKFTTVTGDQEFSYDYGFNPLLFLSDLLEKAHPESVVARKQERLLLSAELSRRAKFAIRQNATAEFLKEEAKELLSGIVSGPFTVPISPNSIVVVLKALKSGTVTVQVSRSADFSTINQTITEEVSGSSVTCRVVVHDLVAASQYFVRCCVEEADPQQKPAVSSTDDHDLLLGGTGTAAADSSVTSAVAVEVAEDLRSFRGVSGGHFRRASCWTLPAEDGTDEQALESAATHNGPGTPGSRPGTARSDGQSSTAAAPEPQAAMFSMAVMGRVDASLSAETTSTRAGRPLPWPPLALGRGLQAASAVFAPPAAEAADVWPPRAEDEPLLQQQAQRSRPLFTCLLGDLFRHEGAKAASVTVPELHTEAAAAEEAAEAPGDREYRDKLFRLYKRSQLFLDPRSVLCGSSVLLAWNDTSPGSDQALKDEEAVYKAWSHEKRKIEKRWKEEKKGGGSSSGSRKAAAGPPPAPPLRRPEITRTLAALSEVSPAHDTYMMYLSAGDHYVLCDRISPLSARSRRRASCIGR